MLAATLACSSPNRGRWQGTFEGGVDGTMEFTVNARGTEAEGKITGATRRGEKFEADFEGSLNQGFLNADFEGSSQTGVGLPAGFRGKLQGDLARGQGRRHLDRRSDPGARALRGRVDRDSGRRTEAGGQPSNRYPTRCCVMIQSGRAGSSSSFLRSFATCMSTVRVFDPPWYPHTASSSCWRVRTSPRCSIR